MRQGMPDLFWRSGLLHLSGRRLHAMFSSRCPNCIHSMILEMGCCRAMFDKRLHTDTGPK